MFYFQDKEAKMAELTLFFVQEHVGICSWTKLKTCFPIGIVLYTFNLSLSKICYHPIDHVFTPSAMLFYKSAKIFNLFFQPQRCQFACYDFQVGGMKKRFNKIIGQKNLHFETHTKPYTYYLLSITMLICACAILCTYLLICCIV